MYLYIHIYIYIYMPLKTGVITNLHKLTYLGCSTVYGFPFSSISYFFCALRVPAEVFFCGPKVVLQL